MCPEKAPRDVTQPTVEMMVRNSLRRVAAGEALKNRRGSEAHRDKVGRERVMIPEKRHSIMSPEIVGRKEGCGLR